MLHAEMGPTHVNALLSSLNIPTAVCVDTLKAREHEIGPAIENIANKFCDLEMEKEKMEWGSIMSIVGVNKMILQPLKIIDLSFHNYFFEGGIG